MAVSLERLASQIAGADNLEQLTRPMLAVLEKVTHLESTYLTTIDENAGVQKILYARNIGDLNIPEGLTVEWSDTLCKRALEERQFLTKDVPSCWGDSAAAAALGLQTYLSSPVYTDDGALFGTLCGASQQSVDLDPAVTDILELFSRLIAQQATREKLTATATARAEAAERRVSQLEFVAEFGDLCLSAPNLQLLLGGIAKSFSPRRQWSHAIPFMLESNQPVFLQADNQCFDRLVSELLRMAHSTAGYYPEFANSSDTRHLGESLAETDIEGDRDMFLMCAAGSDEVQGGVLLIAANDTITDAERALVRGCWQTLTLYAEREYEHAQLEAANTQLSFHARHDPLTQLANRRYLVEEMQRLLAHAARTDERVLVVFIDLDDFKIINDQHGHDVGDDFLQAIAERLTQAARKGDLVARYGGDEFVLVGANAADQPPDAAQTLLQRLQLALTGEYVLPTVTINYRGPSMGLVTWQGRDIPDADELLAEADKAMYVVKQQRRAATK